MKRFALFLLLVSTAMPARALRVVTTVPSLAAITKEVGGGLVEVESIARGVQDPHYLEAKPSFMRDLNKADLLIFNGLELEVGWLPLIVKGARNDKLTPGSPGLLDASENIERLEVPVGQIDRSMGDVHPEGNPHYLLDPRNGVIVSAAIAKRLSELDPTHAADYAANQKRFAAAMGERIADWESRLRSLKDRPFVAYHKTFTYLADWIGFKVVGFIEEKPGIPPSPRHLAELSRCIDADGVHVVIYANYNPKKQVEGIAERTAAAAVELPADVGAEKSILTYADLFETIVKRIGAATP
ncbi:MAG: metal ABC transporter substrate-binding protein [Candidatus Poribacteria bacterium]|nr:metal ABC transporter substrate-binding protein [Candidatus Poribacteria bacterium]